MLIAATLTLLVGLFSDKENQWVEGVSIYAAVLLILFFSSSNEHLREKQFLKNYKEIIDEECMVVRGQYGTAVEIKCVDLVVGDIIQVETGMKVPADCIIIEGTDITVDESIYHPCH